MATLRNPHGCTLVHFSRQCSLLVILTTMTLMISEAALQHRLSRDQRPHHLNAQQTMAFQQVVRAMMGFSGDVQGAGKGGGGLNYRGGGGGSEPLRVFNGVNLAPRYMQRLYEKYLNGEPAVTREQMTDTVRNIYADLAFVNDGSLFMFNLSSLGEAETILRAEIHIYRRRLKAVPSDATSPKELGTVVVKTYELGPGIIRETTSFRLTDAGHSGWHTFDVTATVQSCFVTNRMLAVSFADGDQRDGADTDGRSSVKLRMSRFVRQVSKPYLVVFSQERKNNSVDVQLDGILVHHLEDPNSHQSHQMEKDSWRWDYDNPLKSRDRHIHKRKNKPSVQYHAQDVQRTRKKNNSDEIFEMESFSGSDRTGRSSFRRNDLEEEIGGEVRAKFYHAGSFPGEAHTSVKDEMSAYAKRKRRDITDNEIPQESMPAHHEPVPVIVYKVPDSSPSILQDRTRRREPKTTPRPVVQFGAEFDDVETPPPRKLKKGNRTKSEKNIIGSLISRFRSKQFEREQREHGGSCGVEKLVLDFADLGWSDWIIAPESFEANYCAGLCSYPMSKKLRATNHATIQSIVEAIGLHPEVPSPCCVPASMSSATLLYMDKDQNIVLKNFPDMTVRSCACR